MKKIIITLITLLWVLYINATIYRVGYTGRPVAGIDFAYNDLQSAVNVAANDDTIQIYQQTATVPNSASIAKPLRIIGFGHTLNFNSGLQVVNKIDSNNNYTYLVLDQGSEGSIVEGLNLQQVHIYVGNVTLTRCRFRHGLYDAGFVPCYGGSNLLRTLTYGTAVQIHIGYYSADMPNITICDCFFDGGNNWMYAVPHNIEVSNTNNANKLHNLRIYNNYFQNPINLSTGIPGQVNGVFTNNIVNFKYIKLVNIYYSYGYGPGTCTEGYWPSVGYNWWYFYPGSGTSMGLSFDQFLIKNNIINTADTVTWPLYAENSIVQNNVFSCASQYEGSTLLSSNNIFKANMNTVFGPLWNDGLVYNDNQLALGASSPAINAGIRYNNTPTNCGVFGGEPDQEYKLSGIPNIPAVYQLATPGVNATSNPFNVTISVRSNK